MIDEIYLTSLLYDYFLSKKNVHYKCNNIRDEKYVKYKRLNLIHKGCIHKV